MYVVFIEYSKSIGFITLFKISEEWHYLHVSKITTNRPSMKYTASASLFKHIYNNPNNDEYFLWSHR